MKEQIIAILEIVLNYFKEMFLYWGFISEEEIDKIEDLIPTTKA